MDDPSSPDSAPPPGTLATPVLTKLRHDGWTPDRQHDFVAALAASGCVAEACRAVGMTPTSAYRLPARPDAGAFRQAWDIALDFAIRRLSDAAVSRALNGVSRPVFYQGEQIGERRHYDEKLTMFLLRYRDPTRYGAWLDSMEARRHPDGAGIILAHALNARIDLAHGFPPDELDPDRPLAEGPRPVDPEDVGDEHLSPDVRDIRRELIAYLRRHEEGQDADPTVADNRDPLTAFRPRDSKGCGDVA